VLHGAADPHVVRARRVSGGDAELERWTCADAATPRLERHRASDVQRAFLASANSDRPALKAVASQRLQLTIARHQTHHPRRRQIAGSHRERQRRRQLKVLGDAERQHRFSIC